jgi:hypothetical protein
MHKQLLYLHVNLVLNIEPLERQVQSLEHLS